MRNRVLMFCALTAISLTASAQVAFNPANGHTYKLTGIVADVNAARAEAALAGGNLVTIDDGAEQAFVFGAFSSFFGAGGIAFIGLSDELFEGSFLWDDGTPFVYQNWSLFQPNDPGAEDWVAMLTDGTWADVGINAASVGIIELPIGAPSRLVLAPGADLVRNLAAGTFTLTGAVAGIETPDGFLIDSPTVDPLVGGSVTVSGNLIGNDPFLVGTSFGATQAALVATPGSDSLTLTGTFQHQPGIVADTFKLGGALGCLPMDRRALNQAGFLLANRVGTASRTLNGVQARLGQGGVLSLVFEMAIFGDPGLESVALDFDPAPVAPETNLGTDGAGSLQVGIVGAGANAVVHNLFDPAPASGMPGGGAFFGLGLTPFSLASAMQPLGAHPFHVATDANGAYFWGLPAGSIPPMLIDMVSVGVVGGQIAWQSPVVRVQF
ncbi:MAG: lectin-like protein [Planctomycetota bacterium]